MAAQASDLHVSSGPCRPISARGEPSVHLVCTWYRRLGRGFDRREAPPRWLAGLLVRYRTSDGHQRSRQFKRKRDAEAHVNLIEVDRLQGALIDPAWAASPSVSGGIVGGRR